MKLSIKKISALPVGKTIRDSANLYFKKTKPDGGKWCFRYQKDGRNREMGLGPYPVISIEYARKQAHQNQILLYEGEDPLALKQKSAQDKPQRLSHLFSEAARAFIERNCDEWTSAVHSKNWASSMERLVYPILDQKPLADLNTGDVLRVIEPLWRDKRSTARKLQGRIKMVFAAAIAAKQYKGENPAKWEDHLSHYFASKRNGFEPTPHRWLTISKAPKFYNDLCGIETASSAALRFTMLTAARTSEVRLATPAEFDLNKMLWQVPAHRMKARIPHNVALSEQAACLIEGYLSSDNLPFVFYSKNPEKPLSNMAMLSLLNKQLKEYDTTVHGLRSTFRTWAGEQGVYDSLIIEFALAHQLKNPVERSYMHSDLLTPRRKLMQDWADFIAPRD